MNDLFVFYQAHNQQGHVRINNLVFKDHPPVRTVDDIGDLEQQIKEQYDYIDVKVQCWRRMEA